MIAETEPGAVVVYTWNVDPALVEVALSKGCRGYLDKSLGGQDLVSALERVAAGEIVVSPTTIAPLPDPRVNGDWPGRGDGLSAREAEIVTLITQGLTNADIAARTFLSINSVKTYIRSAYRKMGVARRSQAVRWGLEHGMSPDVVRRVDPDPEASRRVVAENGEPGGSAQAGTKTTTE